MRTRDQPPQRSHLAAGDEVSGLLQRVHRLELAARHNAAGLLRGDYLTAVHGQGMAFHEIRKYVPGESIRQIEWNITARLGEPYVKVHREERQREVVIALDVSPSMHTGFQQKTKLEMAVELAATLAVSVIDSGDRLGYVLFADRVLEENRPRGGRPQLFRALRAFLAHTAPWTRPVAESDPRAAIHAIERHRRGRFVIFLISDFIDHDLPDDLKYARARHSISLLHVYDPVEYATDSPVIFQGASPEGAARRAWLRPGEAGSLAEMQRFLRRECGARRMAFASCSTALGVRATLGALFHRQRQAVR